ncbi:MAG: ethanolamine utilization protein EutJ, partial [Deltaproteobacteria bacterium]|nr:ethanolamine utilization protein EutJ [Deltaproteobacteria bacterium]
EHEIDGGTALSYDMVYLLADAIERAGKIDRKLIRDALAVTNDFVGVAGTIKFDDKRNPIKPAVILKFEDGEVKLLKQVFP